MIGSRLLESFSKVLFSGLVGIICLGPFLKK